MELKIETKVFPDRIELEEIWKDQSFSVQKMLTKQIIDLKDNAVRDALISLGWTPPAENNSSIEGHPNFEAFIRAFWRRIEPYKNDYDKELPKELPGEFIWAVGTAGILLRVETEQQAKRESNWSNENIIRSARISICKLLGLPLDTEYAAIKTEIERLKRENETYTEIDRMRTQNSIAIAMRNIEMRNFVDNGDGTVSHKRPAPYKKNEDSGNDN